MAAPIKHDISVVFFGSGPVASKSLRLLGESMKIEAVITKPATEAEMHESAPTTPIHTATNRHELSHLISRLVLKSQLGVLVDFGIIVSRDVINTFPLGIINSHFSLLPQWRGADPITFTVLSGQKRSGVSLMLLTEGLDEGPILAQAPYEIPDGITTPELTEKLIEVSDGMLRAIIPAYLKGTCTPMPQEEVSMSETATPTYSRKLAKDDGIINWAKPAMQLEREIRAYIIWPKSRTNLANREVIITRASARDLPSTPGQVRVEDKRLFIGCREGSLEIERLKPAGKTEMSAEAFLAGYRRWL